MSFSLHHELSEEIVSLLSKIEDKQRENDSAHGMDHILGVLGNCLRIFREISCRERIVLHAACLHDIVPRAGLAHASNAVEMSAEAVGDFIPEEPESSVREISACILYGSWEHYQKGGMPNSVESYILRDADLLEAIGARGLARVFAFAGASDLSIGLPASSDISAPDNAVLKNGIDSNPFVHIEQKLLKIRELMHSDTAKKEAEQRHQYIKDFKEAYLRECDWSGLMSR